MLERLQTRKEPKTPHSPQTSNSPIPFSLKPIEFMRERERWRGTLWSSIEEILCAFSSSSICFNHFWTFRQVGNLCIYALKRFFLQFMLDWLFRSFYLIFCVNLYQTKCNKGLDLKSFIQRGPWLNWLEKQGFNRDCFVGARVVENYTSICKSKPYHIFILKFWI